MYNSMREDLRRGSVNSLIENLERLEGYREAFKSDVFITNELDKINRMILDIEEAIEHIIYLDVTIDELIGE